jgi:hypothetical protein
MAIEQKSAYQRCRWWTRHRIDVDPAVWRDPIVMPVNSEATVPSGLELLVLLVREQLGGDRARPGAVGRILCLLDREGAAVRLPANARSSGALLGAFVTRAELLTCFGERTSRSSPWG